MLTVDDAGWLRSVEMVASPNFDPRPDNTRIKLVVIHGISLPPGQYGGGYIAQFFCNQLNPNDDPYFASISEMKVSAHCLIAREGKITQFVSFQDRAWHAGNSNWCGESGCNDFSIGIELEGCDEEAYCNHQYDSLARLLQALSLHYPNIDRETVTGHSDIAPNRKTDPGPAFDWVKLGKLF